MRALPVWTTSRHVLLRGDIACFEKEPQRGRNRPRGVQTRFRGRCYAVLDKRSKSLQGEVRPDSELYALDLYSTAGRVYLLGRDPGSRLELWDLEDGRRLGEWSGRLLGASRRARVLRIGMLPDEPVRIAILQPEGSSLIDMVDLFVPRRTDRPARWRLIQSWVPRRDWAKKWVQAHRVKESLQRVYKPSLMYHILDRVRGLCNPDEGWDRELANLVRSNLGSAMLFFAPETGKLYLDTPRPLSLTEIHGGDGTYRFISLSGALGHRLQTLTWSGSWHVMDLAMGHGKKPWFYISGVVQVPQKTLVRNEPQAVCTEVHEFGGELFCVFAVELLVAVGHDDRLEGWLLYDGLRERTPIPDDLRRKRVLRVTGSAVELLTVATSGEEGVPAFVVLQRDLDMRTNP